MSLKTEAIKRFLTAAKSLADQVMSKEAIEKFARNEFGQISELFQKQIDSIFKMKSGIGELFGFKNFPKNLCVRVSAPMLDTKIKGFNNTSSITKNSNIKINCNAFKNEGKCLDCRLCWNKSIKDITYKFH